MMFSHQFYRKSLFLRPWSSGRTSSVSHPSWPFLIFVVYRNTDVLNSDNKDALFNHFSRLPAVPPRVPVAAKLDKTEIRAPGPDVMICFANTPVSGGC